MLGLQASVSFCPDKAALKSHFNDLVIPKEDKKTWRGPFASETHKLSNSVAYIILAYL